MLRHALAHFVLAVLALLIGCRCTLAVSSSARSYDLLLGPAAPIPTRANVSSPRAVRYLLNVRFRDAVSPTAAPFIEACPTNPFPTYARLANASFSWEPITNRTLNITIRFVIESTTATTSQVATAITCVRLTVSATNAFAISRIWSNAAPRLDAEFLAFIPTSTNASQVRGAANARTYCATRYGADAFLPTLLKVGEDEWLNKQLATAGLGNSEAWLGNFLQDPRPSALMPFCWNSDPDFPLGRDAACPATGALGRYWTLFMPVVGVGGSCLRDTNLTCINSSVCDWDYNASQSVHEWHCMFRYSLNYFWSIQIVHSLYAQCVKLAVGQTASLVMTILGPTETRELTQTFSTTSTVSLSPSPDASASAPSASATRSPLSASASASQFISGSFSASWSRRPTTGSRSMHSKSASSTAPTHTASASARSSSISRLTQPTSSRQTAPTGSGRTSVHATRTQSTGTAATIGLLTFSSSLSVSESTRTGSVSFSESSRSGTHSLQYTGSVTPQTAVTTTFTTASARTSVTVMRVATTRSVFSDTYTTSATRRSSRTDSTRTGSVRSMSEPSLQPPPTSPPAPVGLPQASVDVIGVLLGTSATATAVTAAALPTFALQAAMGRALLSMTTCQRDDGHGAAGNIPTDQASIQAADEDVTLDFPRSLAPGWRYGASPGAYQRAALIAAVAALPAAGGLLFVVGVALQRFMTQAAGVHTIRDAAGAASVVTRATTAVSLPSVLTIFIALLLEPLVAASVSLLERSTTVTQDVGIVAVTGVTYLGAVALCVIKASSLFYPSRGAVVTYVPDVCIVPRIVGDQNQTLIRSCTWFLFGDGEWDCIDRARAHYRRCTTFTAVAAGVASGAKQPDEGCCMDAHAVAYESDDPVIATSAGLPDGQSADHHQRRFRWREREIEGDHVDDLSHRARQLKFVFASYRGPCDRDLLLAKRTSSGPTANRATGSCLAPEFWWRALMRPYLFYPLTAVTAVVCGALATTSALSCDLRAWTLFGVQLVFAMVAAAIRPQRVPASNLITSLTAFITTVGYLLCALALEWDDATTEELLAAAQSCAAIVSGLGLIATVRAGMRTVLIVVDKFASSRQATRDAAEGSTSGLSDGFLLTDALAALIPDYVLTAGRDRVGGYRDANRIDDLLAVPMLALPSAAAPPPTMTPPPVPLPYDEQPAWMRHDRDALEDLSDDELDEDLDLSALGLISFESGGYHPTATALQMPYRGERGAATRSSAAAAVDSIVSQVLARAESDYYNATNGTQMTHYSGFALPLAIPAWTADDWEVGDEI